jgi:hypothetical protein
MGQKTEHLIQTGTMENAMFVRLPGSIRASAYDSSGVVERLRSYIVTNRILVVVARPN